MPERLVVAYTLIALIVLFAAASLIRYRYGRVMRLRERQRTKN